MIGDIRKTMRMLRQDAIERGMPDLAEAYGWAAIRLGFEILSEMVAKLEAR